MITYVGMFKLSLEVKSDSQKGKSEIGERSRSEFTSLPELVESLFRRLLRGDSPTIRLRSQEVGIVSTSPRRKPNKHNLP